VTLVDEFRARIDELALLLAGEPYENKEALVDAICEDLKTELSDEVAERILGLVSRRSNQMERNAMPVRPQ
jgi:hypothetical protein